MRLPDVTDHAVLRYCERVLGLDMEGVRRRIAEQCQYVGSARAVHCGSFAYQLGTDKDGRRFVATVHPKSNSQRRVPRDRRYAAEAAE